MDTQWLVAAALAAICIGVSMRLAAEKVSSNEDLAWGMACGGIHLLMVSAFAAVLSGRYWLLSLYVIWRLAFIAFHFREVALAYLLSRRDWVEETALMAGLAVLLLMVGSPYCSVWVGLWLVTRPAAKRLRLRGITFRDYFQLGTQHSLR